MFSLDTNENVPVHTVTENNGVIVIDSSGSTLNGEEVGLTSGKHRYRFTRTRLIPDLTTAGTPLSFTSLGNASESSGVWSKSINTNGWNSGVQSDQTFSGNEVFAVEWELDQITNWTKLMGGLTSANNVNKSYKGLLLGLYQLNNYLYNFYYRSGKATHNENIDYDNREINPGDSFIISVSNGLPKFYIRRNSALYYMGTSNNPLSGELKLAIYFNRGANKTGNTTFTNAYVHTDTTLDNVTHTIEGVADDPISEEDIESLQDLGYVVSAGSTYGMLQLTRNTTTAYNDNGSPTPCSITHEYYGNARQSISSF